VTARLYALEVLHPGPVVVTVKPNTPVTVGVPTKVPPLDSDKPAGRAPAVTANVGPVLPMAVKVKAYGAPNRPPGNVPAGGDNVQATTLNVKSCVAGVPIPFVAVITSE
jgi:hypothetical protein